MFYNLQIPTPIGDLAQLTPDTITNDIVISITKAASGKKATIRWKDVATVMSQVYGTHFPPSTITSNFKGVVAAAKRKRDEVEKEQYLQEIYTTPNVVGKRKMFTMSDAVEEPLPKHRRTEPFEQVSNFFYICNFLCTVTVKLLQNA